MSPVTQFAMATAAVLGPGRTIVANGFKVRCGNAPTMLHTARSLASGPISIPCYPAVYDYGNTILLHSGLV
jgi:hypothetical protein